MPRSSSSKSGHLNLSFVRQHNGIAQLALSDDNYHTVLPNHYQNDVFLSQLDPFNSQFDNPPLFSLTNPSPEMIAVIDGLVSIESRQLVALVPLRTLSLPTESSLLIGYHIKGTITSTMLTMLQKQQRSPLPSNITTGTPFDMLLNISIEDSNDIFDVLTGSIKLNPKLLMKLKTTIPSALKFILLYTCFICLYSSNNPDSDIFFPYHYLRGLIPLWIAMGYQRSHKRYTATLTSVFKKYAPPVDGDAGLNDGDDDSEEEGFEEDEDVNNDDVAEEDEDVNNDDDEPQQIQQNKAKSQRGRKPKNHNQQEEKLTKKTTEMSKLTKGAAKPVPVKSNPRRSLTVVTKEMEKTKSKKSNDDDHNSDDVILSPTKRGRPRKQSLAEVDNVYNNNDNKKKQSQQNDNTQGIYEIEKIIDYNRKTESFLIRWVGYPRKQDYTWESWKDLSPVALKDANELLQLRLKQSVGSENARCKEDIERNKKWLDKAID